MRTSSVVSGFSSLPPPPAAPVPLLRRVAPFFVEERVGLLAALVLAIVAAVLGASEPYVLKLIFDGVSTHAPAESLGLLLGGLVALLVAREVFSATLDWIVWRTRIRVNFRLLSATVDRLHSLPLSFHREESVGALMTRVERGISGTVSAFSDVAFHLVPALVYLVVSAVVMIHMEWRLGLVVMALAPLPAVIGALASKEQVARERVLMKRWTAIFSRFNEVLSGIVVVKSFVMEEQEKRRFLGGVREANELVVAGVRRDASVNALKNGTMALARVAALALGSWMILGGRVPLGTLVAFVGYVGGVFQPVQAVTAMYQSCRRGLVSLETVVSILDAQDSLGDAPDAREAVGLRGKVEFRDVVFGYRNDQPVLKGVSFTVHPGETVALVGPSGAGKTTLMALLQRLYDPTSGAIRVDDVDLRAFKQRSLREHIGVVLQEALLFSDTIRDNIAFGRPHATKAEIEAAARAANAHDFIMKLPLGYDTPVGERGGKLSGGERQRIAIARALLKDPPILVLDEATAALDAEAEAEVNEALERLMKGRTSFIIAHRLSTVTRADRILVVKDGGIQESGTHRELVESGGYYASLVAHQVRGLALHAPPRRRSPLGAIRSRRRGAGTLSSRA